MADHKKKRSEEDLLPKNLEAEMFILGSILIEGSYFVDITGAIRAEMFALDKHQTIWRRMAGLAESGEEINRVTVANELVRYSELESIGGLGYLISLDDGMPRLAASSLNSYVRIVVEKYRLRRAIYIARKIAAQAVTGEMTADEIVLDGQSALSDQTGGYGSNRIETTAQFLESYPGGLNVFLDPSRADPGIPTGFSKLDDITGGIHGGEIFVVGARPATGKTAYAACLAKTVARTNKRVAVFTLELSKEMFLHRMICEEAFVPYQSFRKGELDEEQRRRVRDSTQLVMEMPLYVDDTSGMRIADMRVKLNQLERTSKVDLIVVDYAQLLRPPKGVRFATENDKFTLIGEEIKALTKSTGIPMLLLSQLNRESEKAKGDNTPKLSQCRGAGIWEEISFVGSCLYREWLRRREREDLRNYAELLVEKNRSGPADVVPMRFLPWLMRFSDPEN